MYDLFFLFLDSVALSVVHLSSPLGSQVSFSQMNQNRIENVADWEAISKKYRALVGDKSEDSGSMRDSEADNNSNVTEAPPAAAAAAQMGNNINAAQNQV